MPRIVRELPIPQLHDLHTLDLHEGAQFLGFIVLSELHNDFAVSWWLDDDSLPKAPALVWLCLTGDPLPEHHLPIHLASIADLSGFPRRLTFDGVHLFRLVVPPKPAAARSV